MTREVAIVAHRGASWTAPENTLAAVLCGWEERADAVEVDVHLTRDGEVVVIHDETLLRTTGCDARVDELALAEIRRLDAGLWKGAAWQRERVPLLGEVLATVTGERQLFIELKAATGLVPALQRVVKGSAVPEARLILISFEAEVLKQAKTSLPGCRALFLADTPEDAAEKRADLVSFCQTQGFDGLGVSAGWSIDAQFVEQLRAAHLELNVWTVNDPDRARALVAAGVASITTDRPGWLRQQLTANT